MHDRSRSTFLGLLLIVVGVFFLLARMYPEVFSIDFWWPTFVLLPGIAMLGVAFVGVVRKSVALAGFSVPGCIVSTVGAILLFANTTGYWQVWAYAWALIPAAVGAGLLMLSLAGSHSTAGPGMFLVVAGLLAFIVFGLSFEANTRFRSVMRLWPALLVILGAYILLREGHHK